MKSSSYAASQLQWKNLCMTEIEQNLMSIQKHMLLYLYMPTKVVILLLFFHLILTESIHKLDQVLRNEHHFLSQRPSVK